jgi:predicted nuclease of predicted toxin-antitoxin system
MRLLLNACFGREVERTLSRAGHDVAFAPDRRLGRADDPQILLVSSKERRVCVTLDDGFKRLQWPEEVASPPHPGIVVVRVTGERMDTYGQVLLRFLNATGGEYFSDTIFVVRRNGYERRSRDRTEWVDAALL